MRTLPTAKELRPLTIAQDIYAMLVTNGEITTPVHHTFVNKRLILYLVTKKRFEYKSLDSMQSDATDKGKVLIGTCIMYYTKCTISTDQFPRKYSPKGLILLCL
jgi:hypothetical protein